MIAITAQPLAATKPLRASASSAVKIFTAEGAEVRRAKREYLGLPAGLAARVAFLAKLHREKNVKAWLTRAIQRAGRIRGGCL